MGTFEEDVFMCQTEKKGWDVVKLPLEQQLSMEIGLGYTIESKQGLSGKDKDTGKKTIQYRIVELLKDGVQVFSDENTEYNVNRCGIDETAPPKLFSHVKAYLEEKEPNKIEWMRKEYAPEPSEIQPWDRYNGDKTKNIPTREYFIYGKTPATTEAINKVMWSDSSVADGERFKEECAGQLVNNVLEDVWFCNKKTYWTESAIEATLAAMFVANSIQFEYEEINRFYENELNKIKNGGESTLTIPITSIKEAVTRIKKHAKHAPNHKNMSDMLKEAASLKTMSVQFTQKYLSESTRYIGCNNGIFDTLTGEFTEIYEVKKIDEIMKKHPLNHIDCTYTKGQISEKFVNHLKLICYDNTTPGLFGQTEEEDREIRELQAIDVGYYLRQHIAYLLYPGNPNRIFQFWWGDGKNGKSATVSALKDIFGEGLYGEANVQELYSTDRDIPRSATAAGLSKRVLIYSEAEDDIEKGGKISRGVIVNLVGDDKTAKFRKSHQNSEEITITAAVIATTNQLPKFEKGVNTALLDRLVVIPFKHRITKEETIPNYHKQLLEERDAIFSMIVDDYIQLLKKNLVLPDVPECVKPDIQRLMAGYPYDLFIESEIKKDTEPGENNRLLKSDILAWFEKWCDNRQIEYDIGRNISKYTRLAKSEKNRLFDAMRIYGFRDFDSNGKRYFKGCSWVNEKVDSE